MKAKEAPRVQLCEGVLGRALATIFRNVSIVFGVVANAFALQKQVNLAEGRASGLVAIPALTHKVKQFARTASRRRQASMADEFVGAASLFAAHAGAASRAVAGVEPEAHGAQVLKHLFVVHVGVRQL